LGHYYATFDVNRTGSLGWYLIETPEGSQGAILLLTKPDSISPRSLVPWVTHFAIALSTSPNLANIQHQVPDWWGWSRAQFHGHAPLNMPFGQEFPDQMLLVGGRMPCALVEEILRACMPRRELVIVAA
jgi:hypothetical protein